MIAGYATVAWPGAYGDSGVKTLWREWRHIPKGPGAGHRRSSMVQYNPDESWKVVE
jgi:hypothetical protein